MAAKSAGLQWLKISAMAANRYGLAINENGQQPSIEQHGISSISNIILAA